MDIRLNRESTTPLYKQVKNQIREQILSGEISNHFKLPSERQMAEKLQVHRNTIKKAYAELIGEGLIIASRKSPRGYFVLNEISGENSLDNQKKFFSSLDKNFNYQFLSIQNTFQNMYDSSYLTDAISFAGVVINEEAVPVKYIKELMQEILDSETIEPFWFCGPQGSERLRSALVDMLFNRDIYVQPHNIQIISETYEAISNIAFMYLKQGDYVIVEEPAIPNVVNVFLHAGANILFVPMEEDGIRVDILKNLIENYHPKLIYTMPSFHNAMGNVMSIEKRREFLACTTHYHIPVIEDDSLSEFNYSGKKYPRLYEMDRSNSVIYIDSSGLSFFPGARIGYIVAPESVIKTYRRIVYKDQQFLNSMGQYLWARFMETGAYEQHKKFLKQFYVHKRDLMCRELAKIPGISYQVPEGGLVIWVQLPERFNDRQVAAAAHKKGLLVMPGNVFFAEGGRGESYLRLSFSSASDEEIKKGTEILKKILQ